ncbi:ACP S-malonyltransferase [bacterium]|nr:ACP S-malonyltransferase [bacterium]
MARVAWLALFPGQGSQAPGMAAALGSGPGRSRLLEADDILGFSLTALIDEGPAAALTETANAQPALLAVGFALYEAWRRAGLPEPVGGAGHSLGEYTALTASGALAYADALRLVRRRGEAMQEAVPVGEGGMAALLGAGDLAGLLAEAEEGDCLVAANYNTPGQTVVSGTAAAVGRAVAAARGHGFGRAVALRVSAPFHSPLMAPAAAAMAAALAEVPIDAPRWPVGSNATGALLTDPERIRASLLAQITSPVRWVESMDALAALPFDLWLDVGPGRVVAGLAKAGDSRPKCHLASPPEGIRFSG